MQNRQPPSLPGPGGALGSVGSVPCRPVVEQQVARLPPGAQIPGSPKAIPWRCVGWVGGGLQGLRCSQARLLT